MGICDCLLAARALGEGDGFKEGIGGVGVPCRESSGLDRDVKFILGFENTSFLSGLFRLDSGVGVRDSCVCTPTVAMLLSESSPVQLSTFQRH